MVLFGLVLCLTGCGQQGKLGDSVNTSVENDWEEHSTEDNFMEEGTAEHTREDVREEESTEPSQETNSQESSEETTKEIISEESTTENADREREESTLPPAQTTEETANDNIVSDKKPEEALVGLSVACEEPKTHKEYLDTARAVVKPWLDSLQSREDEYRLPSYTFTDRLAENREFHGDGYVNDGREFVCYVGFDTPKEEEDTVFFAVGTYDTFYHYYFGPGILARFRWEDGVCTLVDYDEAFAMLTSDRLTKGLYGIRDEALEYKTFYDFLNDKENVKAWLEKGYQSRLCGYRITQNVMMLVNGNIIFMDIGNNTRPDYDGNMVTTDMHQYYYDAQGDEKYSSPVDFIDGQGAVVMTYEEGFPLVFDDYNHDGNPDYCIRISSDEYGSTYDVRCMDVNGTPWEDNTEIYVSGAFEESIRLQVYHGSSVLKPVRDGEGNIYYQEQRLFGDKSNATHPEVTEEKQKDYRMYSQRFYLPEALRNYTSQDEEVICYFWNNTEEPVTLEKAYEIQRKVGDAWEGVGTGDMEAVTVECGSHAELCFDIRGIDTEELALYRVKVMAGDVSVYGGFYYGTKTWTQLSIQAKEHPDFATALRFTLENTGITTVYPESAALYYQGEKLCDVDLQLRTGIAGGDSTTVEVTDKDIADTLQAGEYTLEIEVGGECFSGIVTVVTVSPERRTYFSEKATPSVEEDKIMLTLTNNIWHQEDASILRIGGMEVEKEGVWYSTSYVGARYLGYFGEQAVPFGETVIVELQKDEETMKELQNIFDELQSGDYAEYMEEEEYAELMSMTFEDFLRDVLLVAEPVTGDNCRVQIRLSNSDCDSEYVYFEMP